MTEDRQSYGCGRMYVCVPTRPTIMTNRHHKTPPWRIFGAAVRQRFAYSTTTHRICSSGCAAGIYVVTT